MGINSAVIQHFGGDSPKITQSGSGVWYEPESVTETWPTPPTMIPWRPSIFGCSLGIPQVLSLPVRRRLNQAAARDPHPFGQ